MELKCPGQDANKRLETQDVKCPACGREIEMFGDEQKYHCRCGQWVFREALPTCALWCPAAQRCLGEIGNLPEEMRAAQTAETQKEQERRLADLKRRIAKALRKCEIRKQNCPEKDGERPPLPTG